MNLLEALPPERLLFLNQLDAANQIAELVGATAAAALPQNPEYQRDVFTVWSKHTAHTLASVGEFRAHYARVNVDAYRVETCPVASSDHVMRLLRLFAVYSKHTTLSRSGDTFVRCCVASRLSPAQAAGLGVSETPYTLASEVLGDEYNDWTGALFKTPLPDRYAQTEWIGSIACVDACFIFSLAFECLVTDKLHRVLLEHELSYTGNGTVPTIALVDGMPCLCWKTVRWLPPEGAEYPLFHLLILWVQLSAASGQDGCAILNRCFANPGSVGSRDPIYAVLQESIKAWAEDPAAVSP